LRQQEEVDLAGCQCGILEMTGGTGIACLQVVFSVEKIDKECEKQECCQKNNVECLSVLPAYHQNVCKYYEKAGGMSISSHNWNVMKKFAVSQIPSYLY
jgi:hypothetical protein